MFYIPCLFVCFDFFLLREKENMKLDGYGGREDLGGDEGGERIRSKYIV